MLEEVHADMKSFDKVLGENRPLAKCIEKSHYQALQKEKCVGSVFRGRFNDLTMSFFRIITEKNREEILPLIAKEFHDAYNEHKGIGKVSVITAVPLDNELREEILDTGQEGDWKTQVELKEDVDPAIIGGFILNAGSQQIDSSIKHKLKILQLNFSNNTQLNKQ